MQICQIPWDTLEKTKSESKVGKNTLVLIRSLALLKVPPSNVSKIIKGAAFLIKAWIKGIPAILLLLYCWLSGRTSASAQHYLFYGTPLGREGEREAAQEAKDISSTSSSVPPELCRFVTTVGTFSCNVWKVTVQVFIGCVGFYGSAAAH